MIYHGVKIFSMIQFEYYGDDLFIASIFNEYAIECEYPQHSPETFFGIEDGLKVDSILDSQKGIDYDKRASLFYFNGKMNISEYYEIQISDSFNSDNITNLVRNNVVLYVIFCFCESTTLKILISVIILKNLNADIEEGMG